MTTRRALVSRSTVLVGLAMVALVGSLPWFRLNVSPSIPIGLYRLTRVVLPLTPGTLVMLPVPPSVQAVHSWFLPLLKPVGGVPGDVVCGGEELTINGVDYGPIWRVAQGVVLPRLEGCEVVPAGSVFLASQAPRSLDSRYFGLTPVGTLTALALPLVTWR